MTTLDKQRCTIAELCGWVWYRMPPNLLADTKRTYKFLALPAVHEYEHQAKEWMVRATGEERACNVKYMETEFLLPDPHHNANAALALCEKMAREGWRCAANQGTDTTWECEFTRADNESICHYGAGDTLQLAICEAFLQAHGKWTEEDE